MLKKITLLLPILAMVFFISQPKKGHSNSSKPPVFNAGAPGMSTCSSNGCHASNAVNSGDGMANIILNEGIANYTPGQTYTVNLSIAKNGSTRFGFEMVAFDAAGASQGTFVPTTNDVSTSQSGDIEYVHHQSIPSTNSGTFSFDWTAPDSDVGNVTFYTATNASNGNGNAAGDFIYTTSLSVEPEVMDSVMDGINDIPLLSATVYPNPTNDLVFVNGENDAPLTIRVYDLTGKLMVEQVNVNAISLKENLQSGMYLLEITDGAKTAFKRVVLK